MYYILRPKVMVLLRKSLIGLCLLLIGLLSFITRSGAQACPPPTGVSASPVSVCLGNPITLSATIPSGTTTINWYTVSSGGTAIATTTSASTTYTPTAAGTYTFYAEAASGSGGSGTPQIFSYTGAVQSVTLPPGTYTLECWGANGGNAKNGTGGTGGYSTGQITVATATTYYIYVGGKGVTTNTSTAGGWNGGGAMNGTHSTGNDGGTGGGGTDIRTTQNTTYADRIIVGGGGGGATGYNSYTGNGGAGGGSVGAPGTSSRAATYIGQGGTQTAGGAFATSALTNYCTAGGFGVGGNYTATGTLGGNAGGGGYYGGGASSWGGGAGGGSGYIGGVTSGTTVQTGQTGFVANPNTTGDGYVRITPSSSGCASTRVATAVVTVYALPTVAITPATADICSGSSIALTASGATSYSWSPATGLSATVGNAVTASPTTTTTYTVTGTSANSCIATATRTVTVSAAPVAGTLAGTQTICAGSTTTFSVSGNSATGTWSSGSTGVATVSSSGVVTGVSPGTDTITYTVTGTGACSDATATRIVTVNPLPVATATAAGPTTFCTGGSVVLNANTATGISYRWLRNNIVITGATASAYTATTTANYAVIVTNTATGCADTSRPAIAVTVSTIPANTLSFTGTLTFCQGSSVRLQAAVGTGYTYVWYKDSGIIPGATTSSYTATAAGVYYVVITNGSCSTTSITRTVVVNPLPTATATPAGPTAFCNGGSVIIDANTGTGLTYQWQLGTTNIPGATSPSYTATASGTYSVVVSNGTCTNTSSTVVVTVSTMPAPAITATGAPSFCQGGSVTLNATTGAGYTYQWLINSNPIPAATGSSYSAAASGNYSVTITNGTCVATSAPFTVSVTPAPPAIVTPAGPTTFCQGGSVLLNTNRASGYSYQWTKNNINIPGATSWQYTAVATADYAVNIFDGTCPAVSAITTVTVNDFPVAVITVVGPDMSTGTFASYQWYRNGVLIPGATSQAYTAVRDGFYSVVVTDALGCSATSPVQQMTALEVGNINVMSVKLYPNPVENILLVEAAKAVNISINAIDGKQLLKADNAKSIDLSHLPQGLYLVRITDASTGALIRVDKVNKK
jgi:hypothetical protein